MKNQENTDNEKLLDIAARLAADALDERVSPQEALSRAEESLRDVCRPESASDKALIA